MPSGKLSGEPAKCAGQSVQLPAREPYVGREIRGNRRIHYFPELARRLQRKMRDGGERRTTGPRPQALEPRNESADMENPIYIALSRQDGLRRQMDVVANNLANMTTPAYKNQRMMFLEYLAKPSTIGGVSGEKVSMVQDYGMRRNTAAGAITSTNNPLDIALHGNGYMAVETRDGQRYTRSGHLQLDLDRQIVDAGGLPILDEQDRPMTVPQNAGPITITADGTVSTEQGQIGKIKLVQFEREQFMKDLGGGLYTTDEAPHRRRTSRWSRAPSKSPTSSRSSK